MRILCFGLIGLLAQTAWADEASDRRRALDDIERQLGDASRALSDLTGASSASKIDDALRSAERVKDKLRDLERVKGSDSKARDVLSRYPSYIDKLKRAKQPLQVLKKGQRALKDWPRACEDLERDLQRVIKAAMQERGPNSERTLRDKAKALGRKIEDKLREVERQKQNMARAKSDARRFDASDGRWRDVKSSLHGAADRMWSDWQRDYEKGKRACEKLKQGERHPEVSRALDTLKRGAQKRAEVMKRAHEALKRAASGCRGLEASRDASPIQRAQAQLRTVQEQLRALREVQGGDPKAKEITQAWPKALGAAEEGLKALTLLKEDQFSLDKTAKECAEIEATLLDRAQATLKVPSAKSRDALREMAQKLGGAIKRVLEQAEKRAARVRRLKGEASSVSGPGEWRTLGDNVKGSAERIAAHYARRLDEVKRACGELSKGERHREVSQAIRRVDEAIAKTSQSIKALIGEIRALTNHLKAARSAVGTRAVDDARATALTIAKQVEALKRSQDPRARVVGEAFAPHLKPLNAALEGLKTLKTHQATLEQHTEVCVAADKRLAREAKAAQTTQPVEQLERDAKALAVATRGHQLKAEGLTQKLRAAHAMALKFTLNERPWDTARAALKGAADQAHGAFTKAKEDFDSACEEVRKGAKHKAIAEARAALEKALTSAKQEMDQARVLANSNCGALEALIIKRDKRAAALKFFIDKVMEKGDMSVSPSSIENLKGSVTRANKEIEDSTQRCLTAMKAFAAADAAWEALYDR